MAKLKGSLDQRNNSEINITYYKGKKNYRNMRNLLYCIDKNYQLYNTDPLIKHNTVYSVPRTVIIQKENITIDREINNLEDLLNLIEDYPVICNATYNIDLDKIRQIKEPLIELNNMIGIHDLKSNILDQLLFYIQDFHLKNDIDYMHTVLYGSPGTGKTEVAKIIGKIFSKLGILKNGTFKKVVRSDLIAGYLGQTAIKTAKVVEEALGGVLFIDEAYALGNSEKKDSFAKECLDTLCEALSDNKNNLMVIIAGYEEELEKCFFSFNQGLKSRFPWSFKTDKYTAEDLKLIFAKKVKDIGWELTHDLDTVFFEKNLVIFKYFGRDMEILLMKTKIAHGRRVFCKPQEEKTKITAGDLEKGLELFKKHNVKIERDDDNKDVVLTMYN